MTKVNAIEVIDSGVVYRNPQPHLRSRHAYFPTAVELPSGELLVAFDLGSAFEAIDVRSYCSRSSDGGQTWTEPELIFQPNENNHPVSTTCRVGAVDHEELLAWGCLYDRTLDNEGIGNPRTDGFCPTDFVTLRSRDGGRTWSPPQPVRLPGGWTGFETCAPPFALGDGRLLVVTCPLPDWEGRSSPWRQDGLAFGSPDRGETWSELVHVFRNGSLPITAFEQALTRLSDGRFVAVCWTYHQVERVSKQNRVAFSRDGQNFGESIATPLKGETCRLLGLPDDLIIAVYRRVDERGLWAQLARIQNECWIPLQDLQLWTGTALHGTESQSSGAIAQMSKLRFGCPAVLQQKNGDVFVVFWCVEDCVSVIRWIRLRCA